MASPDREILDGIRRGDDNAARIVSERITPLIRHKLFSFDDWEDVRQQCLINIIATIRKTDEVRNLWGLVRRITVCHVIDHNRRHQLTRTIFAESPEGGPGEGDSPAQPGHFAAGAAGAPPDETGHADAFADREMFMYIFQRLAVNCQQLFRLLFIEELTFEEAAAEMDISRGNLRVRLKRCRDRAVTLRDTIS